MDRRVIGTVVLSVLGTLAVLALASLWLVYSGEYDIAATKAHHRAVAWAMETTMEHSVHERASEVNPPPPVDSAHLMTGFHHFEAMCVTCHGAPGRERSEIGKGLLPEPPALSKAAPEWTPAQLFWIVKQGIRMTGMPAFGPTHDDATLWAIVAVLQRLPGMTPQQYEAYRAEAERSAAAGDGHGAASGGGTGGHEHGSGAAQDGTGTSGHEHQDPQGHGQHHAGPADPDRPMDEGGLPPNAAWHL